MDYIRSNVLRRGESTNGQERDVEQQPQPEMGEQQGGSSPESRRFQNLRPQNFSGPSGEDTRNTAGNEEDDGPKTPRINIGRLPSTRLYLPNLARTWTRGESGPPTPPVQALSHPSTQHTRTQQTPDVVIVVEAPAIHPRDQLRGADAAETQLVEETGRHQRHRRARRARVGGSDGQQPKRFLYCFPWIKSRRIRSQILRCFVSGMFLLLLLSVYLALSVTKNVNSSEFTVLLILIILFTTIFFCHGLIRLCMLIVKPPTEEDRRRENLPQMFGPGGYAVPRRPIRVVLARDEEAAGLESETIKLQPPAYGAWRESVRVDPNRIYWQRNEHAQPETSPDARPTTGNRPPSYASEDGVEYVVEARPRSIAPLSDVHMPTHPSERGRLAQRPTF